MAGDVLGRDARLPDHRAATFDTKAAASAWLASVQTDQLRGRFIDPAAAQIPLAQHAETWLAGR